MKKYLYCLLSLYLLSAVACERLVTCQYRIYYYSFGFAFEGFTTQEVDTLILKTYEPGTGFSFLLRTDTVYTTNHKIIDSTIYRNRETDTLQIGSESGFWAIWPGSDYILEIPALQSAIKITEVTQGPNADTFQMEDHCSPGAGQARYSTFNAKFESNYQIEPMKGIIGNPKDNIALVKR